MKITKRIHFFALDVRTWLKTKIGFWCFALSLAFLLLTILLPVWRIVPLAASRPFIPLHYNIYLGVDQLGPWHQIFLVPAIGFGLIVFNVFLQTVAFRKEKLLAIMVAVATVLIQLMLLLAMVLIVLLNLSYAA